MIQLIKAHMNHMTIDEILKDVELVQEETTMFGKRVKIPRLCAWHGSSPYTFGRKTYHPEPYTEALMLLELCAFANTKIPFNSCLLNYYRDGSDSVAWHADDEPEMGPTIVSFSFGAPRRFLLREKANHGNKQEFLLEHGDMLIMGGDLQRTHEHCIAKTKKPVGPRLNLTFRYCL